VSDRLGFELSWLLLKKQEHAPGFLAKPLWIFGAMKAGDIGEFGDMSIESGLTAAGALEVSNQVGARVGEGRPEGLDEIVVGVALIAGEARNHQAALQMPETECGRLFRRDASRKVARSCGNRRGYDPADGSCAEDGAHHSSLHVHFSLNPPTPGAVTAF
jgi:hypothetical protein